MHENLRDAAGHLRRYHHLLAPRQFNPRVALDQFGQIGQRDLGRAEIDRLASAFRKEQLIASYGQPLARECRVPLVRKCVPRGDECGSHPSYHACMSCDAGETRATHERLTSIHEMDLWWRPPQNYDIQEKRGLLTY